MKRLCESKFIRRFFWKTDHKRFQAFLPFFALLNLVIGLLFLFGSMIPNIASLKLFTALTVILPPPFSGALWGFALIVVFIGHCLEMYYRGKNIGPAVGMTGFLLWCYALYIYLAEGAIMALAGIVSPQLFFWGWYYIQSKMYHRELENLEIGPPPLS